MDNNADKKPARQRILIAVNDSSDADSLAAMLVDANYRFAVVADGRDVFAQVASFKPDLILLDAILPNASGLNICRSLKANPVTCSIMILMVTALNALHDIERAVEVGIDDFISTPVDKIGLLKRVEIMLRIRNKRKPP